MMLTQDERLLQNLTEEYLDVHTLHGHCFQIGLWHSDQDCGFEGFDLQACRLFHEQALNTHHDTVLGGHVLRQLFLVLVIELTYKAFHHPIDVRARVSFF